MRNQFRTWMLPEGVVEALPTEAEKLNRLTQIALDSFARWGYQPLRPPIMEFADTFIAGNHNDNLVAQTIQFKDQKSGKQLGFRADMTPQIARIDAHYLSTDKVARYAYAGELVRSYPAGHGSARNPSVIGAELLGSDSRQADIEIVSLLIDFLNKIELPKVIIELGNVDIVVELLSALGIDDSQYPLLFEALATKDKERLHELAQRNTLTSAQANSLSSLTQFYGDSHTLVTVAENFASYPAVIREINHLQDITQTLQARYPDSIFHMDLADVHGYGYHNGLIFSAYVDGVWQAIARGGRYDGFGNDFHEKATVRPSTGFSCWLNLISPLIAEQPNHARVIACALSDSDDSSELNQFVANLRAQGDIVIAVFTDSKHSTEQGNQGQPNRECTHEIIRTGAGLTLTTLPRPSVS